jgi:hypothetical protein
MALPNRITEEQRRANSRIGGIKAQSLELQAQRIVKGWPTLSPSNRPASKRRCVPSSPKRPGNATAPGQGTWGSQR